MARLAYLSGESSRAVVLVRAAYDAAVRTGDPDAAFYAYALGEYARLAGDVVVARAGFEAALAARTDDLGGLVGRARIDAFDGRTAQAIAGLRRAAAIAPQPETLALLGDLLATGGDPAGARLQYDTVRLAGELGALAAAVYDRQLNLFELDHGGASDGLLAAARSALEMRADAGGHDLVAWAAYRLGRFDEARRESDVALATGARDARILFHAGAIALAVGDAKEGRDLLDAALALGPALDPLERAEAGRLLIAH
jgi:tetratricopeptide (TPR) repeat protein